MMKKVVSLIMALILCLSLSACGSNVKTVKEQIDALGSSITIDSGPFIEQAEEAYNSLSDADKKKVTNYSILVSARGQFDEIFKNVSAVISMIDALPKPEDLEFKDGEAISAAWKSYQALTEKEKTKVANLSKLNTAIETVNKIPCDASELFLTCNVFLVDYNLRSSGARFYTQYAYEIEVKPVWDNIRFENVCVQVVLTNALFEDSDTYTIMVTKSGDGYEKTSTHGRLGTYQLETLVESSCIESMTVTSGKIYYNIGQ